MSQKYPGGRISSVPPTPSGPYQNSTASGVWTLEQQAYWEAQNLWPTAGSLDPSAFIENLFQTWVYTGAGGASLNIPNGIDLAGKGGLVWIKSRSTADYGHVLHDTARGLVFRLMTNNTNAQASEPGDLASFNSNGFTTGGGAITNDPAQTYASWTFRKQPKFFDVVTYTGNGVTTGREIAHSLGSAVGAIFVKNTSNPSDWPMWHNTFTSLQGMYLNTTQSKTSNTFESKFGNGTTVVPPTSTVFTVGVDNNVSGDTYVAYLYAHNAGGFGLNGTDNVISCGSFTTDGSGNVGSVNLGYEPQWIMVKRTDNTQNWYVFDTMRSMSLTNSKSLSPNLSGAELDWGASSYIYPTATGFAGSGNFFGPNASLIYIAIRRGPMKVPTTGTSVFSPVNQNGSVSTVQTNFPVDLSISTVKTGGFDRVVMDRLRGGTTTSVAYISTNQTTFEDTSGTTGLGFQSNTQLLNGGFWAGTNSIIYYTFRRAPSYFDEVCYTGDGAARTLSHNLAAVPELMIVKQRSSTSRNWQVYAGVASQYLVLNTTAARVTGNSDRWNSTAPTSAVFSLGTAAEVNTSGQTYVAYLFASCPGVSKVGSFTGTGATQVINCGFTGGARFVLIKATSTTGDWLVWDSARGIVAGNDPYLPLNSSAAEVTNTDWVDTAATGFELSNAGGNLANSNGVSYIFLAIA